MQTFLPYASFTETASALDSRRLGKQRVETVQILRAILVPGAGYAHHTATLMWSEHVPALLEYQARIIYEWTVVRGYTDNVCWNNAIDTVKFWSPEDYDDFMTGDYDYPWFVGNEDVHEAYRSNLVRKAPEYYVPLFGDIDPTLDYIWTKP